MPLTEIRRGFVGEGKYGQVEGRRVFLGDDAFSFTYVEFEAM